ncbi:MAG: class 1 fructose-bisphosphatase [Hyphomicrobiales bacterium]|nr:class 1 fructose-bisphosphatase [Hyphomicrobiales bacterium]
MTGSSLAAFLEEYAASNPKDGEAVSEILLGLAKCAEQVRDYVNQGALGSAFAGAKGSTNADGDTQKELDVLADDNFLDAMRAVPVALYGSEEINNPVLLDRNKKYAIAIDPLDGSSNIDTNVSIGTIFGILPVIGDPAEHPENSFLQPGSSQLAAGYFIYGPQLALVVSVGNGTHIFVYSARSNAFILAYENLKIPQQTSEYGINASNYNEWSDKQRRYIDDCLAGASGPRQKKFNMRWVGSLVADAYRILIRGGVFIYPGDKRKGYANGRLRLVYEANPVSLLAEQAGGAAVCCDEEGGRRILDIIPTELHQRIPLAFGSSAEIACLEQYHGKNNT